MNCLITITNTETKEFFFSTKHCQPGLGDEFVPVSSYQDTVESIREFHKHLGETEIINPNDDYVPDFIIEEMYNDE